MFGAFGPAATRFLEELTEHSRSLGRNDTRMHTETVSVLQFVADSGRYCVRIADDSGSKQIRLKPKNLVLHIGTAVIVTGLATPELNGRHAPRLGRDAPRPRS